VESSLQRISSNSLLWKRIRCYGNEIVRSSSNVILTRQTCGQRSSRAAGGKRRALAFYFSVRIFYVFLSSKCRGESDLGLYCRNVGESLHPLHFGSRSVHDFGTCKENAAAQCRLPSLKRVWPQDSSEVGTAQRHSLCKYRSHAQT